ncbi:MAG: DUF5615 family PIN-like protein [Halothece sp. Uz-M2-17]|nr:DUF5615 family PIN-like protein [Halothece sp. Uz-M2-17]
MKLLIDMNLTPDWCVFFQKQNIEATHWLEIGEANAKDQTLMRWAKENEYIVFTHDLDFGVILASTQGSAPSVIQMRTQQVFPQDAGKFVLAALIQFQKELEQGAFISINDTKVRVRLLPMSN